MKTKEVNKNTEPTYAFILTKDKSPTDSPDDKILLEHFEINPKIEYPFLSIENKHENCVYYVTISEREVRVYVFSI